MSVSTEVVKPVKGLVFKHATRKKQFFYGEGERPASELTVTAVQKGIVHCKDSDYNRVKISLERFEAAVGEVVSVPEAPVKLTDAQCEALHRKAHAAGMAAGRAARPVPMVVQQHASPFDDDSEVVQQWYEPEGLCGFAWVLIAGDTSFARWGRKRGLYGHNYGGGNALWVRHFGQSVDRKESYAGAYAAVLREAGLKAYGQSRLD